MNPVKTLAASIQKIHAQSAGEPRMVFWKDLTHHLAYVLDHSDIEREELMSLVREIVQDMNLEDTELLCSAVEGELEYLDRQVA